MKQILALLIALFTVAGGSAKTFTEECKSIEGAIIESIGQEQIEELIQNGEDLRLGNGAVNIIGLYVQMVIEAAVVTTDKDAANEQLLKIAEKYFSEKTGYEFIAEGTTDGVAAKILMKKHNDEKYESTVIAKEPASNKVAVSILVTNINIYDPSSY